MVAVGDKRARRRFDASWCRVVVKIVAGASESGKEKQLSVISRTGHDVRNRGRREPEVRRRISRGAARHDLQTKPSCVSDRRRTATAGYAAECRRPFRRLGWDVLSCRDRRRRAPAGLRTSTPDVVVLDADWHDESGWLTCRQAAARKCRGCA